MSLTENASGRDNAASWLSDTMRITLFGEPQRWEFPNGSLTEILFGSPPEMEQTSRRGATETRLEATKHEGFQINIVRQGGRIDIHVLTDEVFDDSSSMIRPINDFAPVINRITKEINKISTSFSRVGAGASLIQPQSDTVEVYKILKQRFPCLLVDTDNCDDFLYQINPYTIDEDIRLNHLERWSHGVFERIDIPVMGGGFEGGSIQSRLVGVKLDLDYNTGVDLRLNLDANRASSLLEKLVVSMFERMDGL
ncbi:hypothetical protein [Niveispirillum fermenti]|uniref:hypothetical protein n=1 Tax=Niveispirillum fermenti TaxID=1233113 RepID=UPI003A876F9B